MNLNLRNLLTFLDDPKKGDNRHSSAITGVIGEDLNAAAFAHYIGRDGVREATVSADSPTPGTRSGKRLDRWIQTRNKQTGEKILYQCEIKNWAASAIGGHRLPIDCSEEEVKKAVAHYWKGQLKTFQSAVHPNSVTKVFTAMRLPEQYAESKVQPLVIYWMPMSNSTDANPEPFFQVPTHDLGLPDTFVRAPFETLNVFSVSLYFRRLLNGGTETLVLDMPNAERRAQVLDEIGRE
ncbi:MAG: hypothetical protein AAB417_03660 [Patescibacteria group bacterium]